MSNIWETCCKCSGTGTVTTNSITTTGMFTKECPVCKGKMIISKLTGLPPDYEANKRLHEEQEKEVLNNWIKASQDIPTVYFKNPLTREECYLDKRQSFKDHTDILKCKLNENFTSK